MAGTGLIRHHHVLSFGLDQQIAGDWPDERGRIYEPSRLLAACGAHEDFLDKIRRGIPSGTVAQMAHQPNSLGLERWRKAFGWWRNGVGSRRPIGGTVLASRGYGLWRTMARERGLRAQVESR